MIPKIIHYCWFGEGKMNAMAKRCLASWHRFMPEYQIKLWNEKCFDVSSVRYVSQAYQRKRYAFVSDYVRLYALQQEGGIYLDTDVEVIRSFDDLLDFTAFIGFESPEDVGTGIMASEKNGLWVSEFLRTYEGRSYIRDDGSEDTMTNVECLSKFFLRKGVRLAGKRIDLPGYLTIFPKDYFSPRNWNSPGCLLTENTYSIHYYDGSWMDPRRRALMLIGQRFGARIAHYVDLLTGSPKRWIARGT